MFNPAQEMSSIAFDKILGGALNAVVSAQNNSSLTTVNFIKNVGFQNDENGNTIKPVYVDFKYPKEIAPYQPAIPASFYFTITAGGTGYDEEELNGGAYEVDGKKDVVLNFTVDRYILTTENVLLIKYSLEILSKSDDEYSAEAQSLLFKIFHKS